MASLKTLMLINLLIPGSGLVLRDRPWAGYGLIVLTGLALSAAVVYLLLATESLAAWLGPTVLALWLIAVVLAGGLWWLTEHAKPTDQAALAEWYRRASIAYLRGDGPAALEAARAVVRHAPLHAGAWKLQELAAQMVGDRSLERRSHHQHQHLRRREQL